MTDYQLLNQIDELVASKTFNLDALDGIKKLKDNLKETLEERDALQKRYVGLYEVNNNQGEEITRLRSKLVDCQKELDASRALNDAGQKAIYEAEKHKAVAEAWQGAMAMVFKPYAVRETVQRNHTVMVPSGPNSSYPQSVQNQDHIVREDA